MTIIDDLNMFRHVFDLVPPRRLRCGRAAWDVFRDVENTTDALGLTVVHPPAIGLYGVPVHVDPEMPDGAWELTEDGKPVASGDFAPGHRHAVFVPGVGLVAFLEEPADPPGKDQP